MKGIVDTGLRLDFKEFYATLGYLPSFGNVRGAQPLRMMKPRTGENCSILTITIEILWTAIHCVVHP